MEKIKTIYKSLEGPLTLMILPMIALMVPEFIEDVPSFVTSSIYCLAVVITIIYVGMKYKKKIEKPQMLINKCAIFKIFIIGALTAVLLNILLYYLAAILNFSTAATTDKFKIDIIMLITFIIIQPIAEELCFRGLMRKELENGFNKKLVIIMVTSVFASGHFSSIANIIYALILGYAMIKIYYRYNSLIFPITFHIAANGFSNLLDLIPTLNYDNAYYYLPIAFVASIIVIVLAKQEFRKENK